MAKETKDNSVKTVISVMIIMLLSKVSGFLRDILFAAKFGTDTIESAAFSFASSVPREFLDIVFASAISSSFIPTFTKWLEKKRREEAFNLANTFISVILVLSVVLTVLAILGAKMITLIGLDGSSELPELLTLATSLLRIMLPTIVISGVAFSLTGVLQSLGEFNIPAGMSLISNIIIIIYYLFFIDYFGVYGLVIAFLIGWGSQLLIQVPPLVKKGFRFKFKFDIKNEGMLEIFRLMLPVLVSSWVFPVNTFVNRSIAFGIAGTRGTGALNNANVLYSVITGVFVSSIANVIFPRLSRESGKGDNSSFSDTMRTSIRSSMFLILPMTVGLMIVAQPLVQLSFEREAFDSTATAQTAYALVFYALGMPGYSLQTLLSRGFFASNDGKTPMVTGIVAILVNLLASIGLSKVIGIGGPPLASSIALNLIGIIMLVVMTKRNRGMFGGVEIKALIRMLIATVIMGVVVYAVMSAINAVLGTGTVGQIAALAGSVGVGVIVYMIISYLLRIDEARMVVSFIRRRK